jgi:hypothetical protein
MLFDPAVSSGVLDIDMPPQAVRGYINGNGKESTERKAKATPLHARISLCLSAPEILTAFATIPMVIPGQKFQIIKGCRLKNPRIAKIVRRNAL